MSEVVEKVEGCCASCGIADVELKKCACKLVQYCSVDCQKNHRPQHKKLCKKRLAELRDKDLFTQPDSSCYGECPICFLPLPIEPKQSNMMTCCSKSICLGCCYANTIRVHEAGLEHRCAFCREPEPLRSEEGRNKQAMERIKKNDPVAMWQMGTKHHGEGDYESAFEYWIKAAELGDAPAHYELSCLYREGGGCVKKDMKKFLHHAEEAAIAGHPVQGIILGP